MGFRGMLQVLPFVKRQAGFRNDNLAVRAG
jgi:hypothetical protein